MAITLQEAKEYLRVGYDDDNDYITELIDISEAYIDGCVGTAYREKDKYNSEEEYKRGCRLATLLQKKVISDMYDVRGTTVTIKETFEVEYLYSDDEVEDTTETFVKAEIELEVNRLTPGDYALLFDSLYKSGYLVKSESDRAKEVALGFRAKQNNGKYEFVWYYCGKAEHPEESYETIKDKKTAQTQKITFTFYARKKEDTVDGKAKRFYALKVDESQLLEEHANAKKAIAEWFGAVQEYKADVAA